MGAATASRVVPERAQILLDFWFGPPGDPDRERHRQLWFKSTPEHDDMLRRLFLADHEHIRRFFFFRFSYLISYRLIAFINLYSKTLLYEFLREFFRMRHKIS